MRRWAAVTEPAADPSARRRFPEQIIVGVPDDPDLAELPDGELSLAEVHPAVDVGRIRFAASHLISDLP